MKRLIIILLVAFLNKSPSQTIKTLIDGRIAISNQDTSLVTCIGHGTCPCIPRNIESWHDGKYMILAGKDWQTGLVTTFQVKNGNYCGEVIYIWNIKKRRKLLFLKRFYIFAISKTEYYQSCDSIVNNKKAKLIKIEGEKTIKMALK